MSLAETLEALRRHFGIKPLLISERVSVSSYLRDAMNTDFYWPAIREPSVGVVEPNDRPRTYFHGAKTPLPDLFPGRGAADAGPNGKFVD
ncbi:MAG: hypothetical protein ACTHM2_15885 [Afipia sp.]